MVTSLATSCLRHTARCLCLQYSLLYTSHTAMQRSPNRQPRAIPPIKYTGGEICTQKQQATGVEKQGQRLSSNAYATTHLPATKYVWLLRG